MQAEGEPVDGGARPAVTRRRRRPLVAREAVLRWAFAAGIEVPDGPLDDLVIDLYLNRDDCARAHSPGIGFELVRPEPEPVPDAEPAPQPVNRHAFGPEPCASCGGPGYLDYVDLVRRTQSQRCRRCGSTWVTSIDV